MSEASESKRRLESQESNRIPWQAMTAIPSLTRAHVDAALKRIDREGVPPRRQSTRYQLVVGAKRYPPKYVVSLAAAQATGRELDPQAFSGGDETNSILLALGFVVEGANERPAAPKAPMRKPASVSSAGRRRDAPKPPPVRQHRSDDPQMQPIVRVVVQGRPASSPRAASAMLLEAFGDRWPTERKAKFTLTPGGFISGRFPARWTGGIAWDSAKADLGALAQVAQSLVDGAVTRQVLAAAKTRTQVLTVGVDLMSDAEHAELVALIDCDSGKVVHWTGKSYPTGSQEGMLVQVSDLSTHLVEIADEKVLVLGCHDLNMFSARAHANQNPDGVRRERCDDMARATAKFRPTVVLQHPHSTDSANIWRMPWACLVRDFPSVRTYASGIGYFNWHGAPRRPLRDVLAGTRSETGVLDVVVKAR